MCDSYCIYNMEQNGNTPLAGRKHYLQITDEIGICKSGMWYGTIVARHLAIVEVVAQVINNSL